MKYFLSIFILLIICVLFACKKPVPPQLPSNKGNSTDSTSYFLTQINSDIIAREDSILSDFVEKNFADFQKTKDGFWYKIIHKKTGEKITKNNSVLVCYELFDLNNQRLKTENFVAHFGKKEMTTGLEQGLLLMNKGDSAVFVVPWYLAFGTKGNKAIEPYTSVIYKVYAE
jgi:FKBP-type peptidyl-prolyl cis-trans isomerase